MEWINLKSRSRVGPQKLLMEWENYWIYECNKIKGTDYFIQLYGTWAISGADDIFRGLLPRFCYFVITSCSHLMAGGKPIRKIQGDRVMIFSKGILSTHAEIVGLVYRLKCRREFWGLIITFDNLRPRPSGCRAWEPRQIVWGSHLLAAHRSLFDVPVEHLCLLPHSVGIGTYSQSKIETKEGIEGQINRDGFVSVWRTASYWAGKETRTVYIKMDILKAVTTEDTIKRIGGQFSMYLPWMVSPDSYVHISRKLLFSWEGRYAWTKPLHCEWSWEKQNYLLFFSWGVLVASPFYQWDWEAHRLCGFLWFARPSIQPGHFGFRILLRESYSRSNEPI